MPRRFNTMTADVIRFRVSGKGAQRFLGYAAQSGVRLRHIRPEARGFSASAAGSDWSRLCRTARNGGWTLTPIARRGPGRYLARLRHRPGLAAGMVCFLLLLHWLGGFLWHMDLSLLGTADRQELRAVLAACGVQEGVYVTQSLLEQAQQVLDAQEAFGWVSLNFTGGRLVAEGTPRAQAAPAEREADTVLVARISGEVTAVDIRSGFAQVQPGQYVAAGTVLAAAQKAARSGDAVPQAASGSVTARVRLAYTAQQPFAVRRTVLTGTRTESRTLCLLGRVWQLPGSEAPEDADAPVRVRYLPLCLGRMALPGSICETTAWARAERELTYSADAAAALARRAARLMLRREYPDAVIESEKDIFSATETAAVCRAVFLFRANIAEARPAAGSVTN